MLLSLAARVQGGGRRGQVTTKRLNSKAASQVRGPPLPRFWHFVKMSAVNPGGSYCGTCHRRFKTLGDELQLKNELCFGDGVDAAGRDRLRSGRMQYISDSN